MLNKCVRILGGMNEFVGKTGEVVGVERDDRMKLYRVALDEPVLVPGVGLVKDDLWAREWLQVLKD